MLSKLFVMVHGSLLFPLSTLEYVVRWMLLLCAAQGSRRSADRVRSHTMRQRKTAYADTRPWPPSVAVTARHAVDTNRCRQFMHSAGSSPLMHLLAGLRSCPSMPYASA